MGNNYNEIEKSIDDFLDELYLENTRILYDFLDELHKEYINSKHYNKAKGKYAGYIGEKSLQGRTEKIQKLKEYIAGKIKECKKAGKRLYQNPLNSFISFYENENIFNEIANEENASNTELDKLTEMLNYYNILEYIDSIPEFSKEASEFDSLPYIFEDICLSIKNMTAAKACYLTYKKEGEISQLVSRSGYYIDENEVPFSVEIEKSRFSSFHIGSSEFDLILNVIDNAIKAWPSDELTYENDGFTDMVKKIKVNGQEKYFLVFRFHFRKSKQRRFCIFLEFEDSKEIDNKDNIKKIALRVLCLRNRLSEAVERNYTNLLNFRFDCQYVQSVQNDGSINILHITDLHLEDNDFWNKSASPFCEFSTELKKHKPIDLIAVTGDIVNSSNDAATAQRKYMRAADLLLNIAITLWGTEVNNALLLPHDWKRRILITTGNHDYAAMNDTSVDIKSRQIAVGLPGKSSGGTMQKYAYYIEFLSYFLDAPTQRLLQNDFNEVRTYSRLKLIVGIFNAISKANAYRINKVSFDTKKLKRVLNVTDWKKEKYSEFRHLALAHYASNYSIDYFRDTYAPYKKENDLFANCSNESSCDNCSHNMKCIYPCFIKVLKEQTENFKLDSILAGEFKEQYENCKQKNNKTELSNDMQMLYSILSGKKEFDEFAMKLFSKTNITLKQMERDTEEFNKCYEEIKRCDTITLAGHTHKLTIDNENKIYVGTSLMNQDDKPRAHEIMWQVLYCSNVPVEYKSFGVDTKETDSTSTEPTDTSKKVLPNQTQSEDVKGMQENSSQDKDSSAIDGSAEHPLNYEESEEYDSYGFEESELIGSLYSSVSREEPDQK